ncbi:hypothetical protein [Sinorhizobium meliloti]|uniref:hypothetical protein n=1 Tax=Rhizobium meliloti TaxID=382 RepID=UPI000B499B3F|nr:hypothetical protein [Sinorhizobium meliloti]ASP64367.1 hypothetical protein CDO29_07070 [Sinorhizobium meliloti]MQX02809.1 hypothetical protein [Sinorhizobium meliloti]RVK52067.1 hypothetical protein CN160_09125 [Sinorhizobium meliloti]
MSNDNEAPKHWSAGFQRLRAEVIVLSLVLLAMTQLNVSLDKVPFLGLEVKPPLHNKSPLIAFLYVFAFYFMVAWYSRFRVEWAEVGLPARHLDDFVKNVRTQLDRVQSLDPLDATAITNCIHSLTIASKNFNDSRDAAIKTYISEMCKSVSNLKHIEDVIASSKNVTRDEYIDNLERTVSRVLALLDGRANAFGDGLKSFAQISAEAIEEAKRVVSGFEYRISQRSPELIKLAEAFDNKCRQYIEDATRIKHAITWDRLLLGFWIPFAFALAVLAYPIMQFLLAWWLNS